MGVQKSTPLDWDDLRFALALAGAGSLAKAARILGVDHTTVGRRVEAVERSLGTPLFTRTAAGYALTADGARLLDPLRAVEEAVHAVQRAAVPRTGGLTGTVRVTSPETFGATWLAPRLAEFGLAHPHLVVELAASGRVLDLGRGEADIAVRFFRSQPQNLVVRRVGDVRYGLYASPAYLTRHPYRGDLAGHRVLAPPPPCLEATWLAALGGTASYLSELTIALAAAAAVHGGITVLPRYLGDGDPRLERLPRPDEPTEAAWLTVHDDLRDTPRIRALLDFLADAFAADRGALAP